MKIKAENKRATIERRETQKTPTSRQEFENFFTANLTTRNNIIGQEMISNSAKERGSTFVIVAKAARNIDETYLLKKSANATFESEMSKIIIDKTAVPKKINANLGNFILFFCSIGNNILSKIFVYNCLHITLKLGKQFHFLIGFRVGEAKLIRVQSMAVNEV